MEKGFSPEQFAAERRAYERRPAWELRNVKKALGFHPWLNSPEEKARLAAIEELLRAEAARKRAAKNGGERAPGKIY